MDNDKCGRDAVELAEGEGLAFAADVTFAICQGMPDSEIEDMYLSEWYSEMLKNKYGVSLDSPKFKSNKKWSERMRDTFLQQGKQWTDKVKLKIKREICELVTIRPAEALNKHKKAAFIALATAIEEKLDLTIKDSR